MSVFTRLRDYFIGAYSEMRKVTWPTKKQTIQYSLFVIGMSLVMMVFFGALDFGLTEFVALIIQK